MRRKRGKTYPPVASNDWYSNVWRIKTAKKIKIFIWKSLQNALPVGEQFAIRIIPVSPLCKRCNEEETILHLLFKCPFAKRVWELAPLATPVNVETLTTYRSAWEAVNKIHSLPPNGIEAGTLASWIIWNLWINRNQLSFQHGDFTAEETITKALSDAREWNLAQPSTTPNPPPKPLIRSEPNPNHVGLTPVFTDAAWNPVSGHAGLGWIIDDPVSPSPQSATASHVSSPLLAESLAVHSAITSALSHGLDSIHIMYDSQILINTINRRERNLEIFGVLQDIYHLSASFKSIKFSFVSRSVNVMADTIAKQVLWALNSF
ncbi:hypothetical protein Bca52824_033889 [Brassica carinata]|uniref:RNase H type-1 domain-containing protein n=1 Tax=Brassica carinata TaxID=52824 RepID=A0A8X7SFI7_BRACI|nr:hypothetical protein Bca52824_033889 [Brassica carinata]